MYAVPPGSDTSPHHAVVDDVPLIGRGDIDRFHERRFPAVTAWSRRRARLADTSRGYRDDLAPLGDFGGEVRLLQRGHRDRSLADAHADGLARETTPDRPRA
jgi:hypothetical protein